MAIELKKALVAYDLGGVLFRINKSNLAIHLQETGSVVESVFFKSGLAVQYAKGRITTQEFLSQASKRLPIKPAEIRDAWCSIIDGATKFAINSENSFAIWSNTNELHYQEMLRQKPELKHAQFKTLSFQVGFLKPSKHFFKAAIQNTNLPASSITYYDDKEENILSALQFGVKGKLAIKQSN